MRRLLPTLFLMIPATLACNGGTPTVNREAIIPGAFARTTTPGFAKSGHALGSPSGSSASEGECTEWRETSSHVNQRTGEYDYDYLCVSGGAIERTRTAGRDHLDGTGEYQTTYFYRDGTEVVWTATWTTEADGVTYATHSTSSAGEIDDTRTRTSTSGASELHEVYQGHDGVYTSDGVSEADGRWNGTTTFDDPSTAASPDWTVVSHQGTDGSLEQLVDGVSEGWSYGYRYAVAADHTVDYSFHSDDPTTRVSPDYLGVYHYLADGSGQGGYTQHFDDGSVLEVSDQIAATGAVVERWTYDDATTSIAPDEEGSIDYATDGSGRGTVTTHVQGGGSEVCDVSVAADGTSGVFNCR